ncbi:hypothetical protein [Pseudomonas plecoglossicida]|uniref:hypothetical protein n=1 Tax=Pseudomonas plecoglossicida TaxID=70775 RepID=UPI0015E093E1|nr:hypothetical protein [Pseudomonas plecoglossicida]
MHNQKAMALQPALIPLHPQMLGVGSHAQPSAFALKSNIRAMTWSVASAAVYASFSSRTVAVIRIDTIWLATEPMDMCAGTETAMARLIRRSVRRSRTALTCLPTYPLHEAHIPSE